MNDKADDHTAYDKYLAANPELATTTAEIKRLGAMAEFENRNTKRWSKNKIAKRMRDIERLKELRAIFDKYSILLAQDVIDDAPETTYELIQKAEVFGDENEPFIANGINLTARLRESVRKDIFRLRPQKLPEQLAKHMRISSSEG